MKQVFIGTVLVVLMTVTALLLVLPTPAKQARNAATKPGDSVLIENAYVAGDDGERQTASILMQNGFIQDIGTLTPPAGATIIDGSGLTAIPGLIDSHTHSYGTALADALRFGVTTTVDMFTPPSALSAARALRQSTAPATDADLFSAGNLATIAGGHGTQFGIPIDTLSAPSEAAAFVRDRIAEGSDFIKLVYMPDQGVIPSLDRATAKALIDAAHSNGLLAVAHISTQRAALDMVREGVDGLVHVFADGPVSDEFIKQAKASDIFVIPTLAVIASITGQSDPLLSQPDGEQYLSAMQKQSLQSSFPDGGDEFDFTLALDNVRDLHAAGITLLAGSDAPNPGTAHGVSLHHEMELLESAGLTAAEAMRSATVIPARIFGLESRGALVRKGRADLLLVRGNPYKNITASRQIQYVIKNGHAVGRETFAVEKAPEISTELLGGFDRDLEGPDGFAWDATTDAIAGGQSVATVKRIARDEGCFALAVTAEVRPGFAWPWAGAGLGSADSAAVDVSEYSAITFDVKGTPGTYRFMLFSGAGAGAPPVQEFAVSEAWTTVRLPLSGFAGFDPEAFSMLGVVAGPQPQRVAYVIDEVRFEP